MTNRPCRFDADLHGIWQMLLPDVPLPACGVPNADHPIDSVSTTSGDRQVNRHNAQVHRGTAGEHKR
jgi:hypothetical protein